jgi:hypothetical protein
VTTLGRFLRRALERFLGLWREGPVTPSRFFEQVEDFRAFYPDATVDDWAGFAANLADNAYAAGYARGFEADLRQGFSHRHPSPSLIADTEEPGWRDSPPVEFE